MVGKVLDEKAITLSEVKDILEKRTKGIEATYEQKQTTEYVKEFSKIKPDKAQETVEKLIELGVDRKQAVKIVDLLPKDNEDLKLIFSKAHYSVSDEVGEQILELVRGLE